MLQEIVFDIDGTLVDSVDLHALAWHAAFGHFGHSVSFQQARSQIGKGGDQLIPTFLSDHDIADHGAALEEGHPRVSNPSTSPAFDLFRVYQNFFGTLTMPGLRLPSPLPQRKTNYRSIWRLRA